MDEAFDLYIRILNELRTKIHGFSILPTSFLTRLKDKKPYWCVIARDKDKPVGFMLYKITGYLKELEVKEFGYLNSTAKYLLLQFIAKLADQIKTIQLPIAALNIHFKIIIVLLQKIFHFALIISFNARIFQGESCGN